MGLKDLFFETSPDRLIVKARRLAEKGKREQAQRLLEEALQRLGEEPRLRFEQATLFLMAGDGKRAGESLRALLKADAGETQRAREFIEWARDQFPDISPLRESLAESFIIRRKFSDALECIESIDKEALESLLDARLANLNRFLETGAAVPRSAGPILYFGALGYTVLGDWERAVDSYRKILSSSPAEWDHIEQRLRDLISRHSRSIPLRLAFADILENQGRPEDALKEYLIALQVDPRCVGPVEQFIESMLKSSPDDPELLWAKVQVLARTQRYEEVIDACDGLVDLGEHLSDIERMLGDFAANGKETPRSQLLLARVCVKLGKGPHAVSNVISALEDNPTDRGIEVLEQVIRAFPDQTRPYQILADHFLRKGNVKQCLQAYRSMHAADPSTGQMITERLQMILSSDPDNAEVLRLLEELCTQGSDPRGAVPFLRERLRQDPAMAGEIRDRFRALSLAVPDDPAVRLGMAEASYLAGDAVGAWSLIEPLVKTSRSADGALLHLFVLCAGFSPEMFAKAKEFVASRGPDLAARPEMVFAMAEAAAVAGRIRDALDNYQKVMADSPEAASICHAAMESLGTTALADEKNLAAVAEALLMAGQCDKANKLLRTTVSLSGPSVTGLIGRLEEARRTDSTDLATAEALVWVYLASGQLARARRTAHETLAGHRGPESSWLAVAYGDASALCGEPGKAIRAYATAAKRAPEIGTDVMARLEKLLQRDPGLAAAHLVLGRLLMAQGRTDEGLKALRKATSLQPDLASAALQEIEGAAARQPAEASVN
ncbi:MAG: tetratricopeptide repeat protein, partial [Acidobacteriota bacterium]